MLTIKGITYLNVDLEGYEEIVRKFSDYPSFIETEDEKRVFAFLVIAGECNFEFRVLNKAYDCYLRLHKVSLVKFKDFIADVIEGLFKGRYAEINNYHLSVINLYSLVFFFSLEDINRMPLKILDRFGIPRDYSYCIDNLMKLGNAKLCHKLAAAYEIKLMAKPYIYWDSPNFYFGLSYLKLALYLFRVDKGLLDDVFRLDNKGFRDMLNKFILFNEHLLNDKDKETLKELKDYIVRKMLEN